MTLQAASLILAMIYAKNQAIALNPHGDEEADSSLCGTATTGWTRTPS